MITIYLISNTINRKKYVGQTVQGITKRWARHCWLSTRNSSNMIISAAIAKYGEEAFFVSQIDSADSLEEANEKEVFWAKYYNCFAPHGYNLKAGGRTYCHLSEEVKKKIGDANRGKRASDETRKRLSEAHKGFVVSDSTKQKLSRVNKGKRPHRNTIAASVEACQKAYSFINPSGCIINIVNLSLFCKENKLPRNRMNELANAKRDIYKGWTRSDTNPQNILTASSKQA